MAQLQYKTRGMSNPKGKPKIYFCCHPNDFNLCFEAISEDILAKQDCAIWYDSTMHRCFDETRRFDLGQMQLFVMPITNNLLTTRNCALDEEFQFAIEQHIPVLPVMQESGLEELFNQKCGNLQFLDRNLHDDTAISYDEKLDKYLSTVLIGDELAKRIREAFDAYVFLSYRKKDRKYAQELMRLMHRNNFFRDIAIWYDEFLTPGEDFNDVIAIALQKSELFTLVVTPNLINETNYIMTTEYPAALDTGKTIFPAEVVATDKKILQEKYKNIPECVNACNHAELSASLRQTVEKMALRKSPADPQHNFFIGLAYLGGVDVEINHEIARELITSAAEAELPEAIEKLVNMYNGGVGVNRSFETAIEWQKKLVDLYYRQHEMNNSKIIAMKLAYALWKLGNMLTSNRHFSVAKAHFQMGLDYCKRYEKEFDNPDDFDTMALLYFSIGAPGWPEQTKDAITSLTEVKQAQELWSTLFKQYPTSSRYIQMARISEHAIYTYERFHGTEKTGGSELYQLNQSSTFILLGDNYIKEGNYTDAKRCYNTARKIRETLSSQNRTIEILHCLCVIYERLGKVNKAEGNINLAKYWFAQAIDIQKEIVHTEDANNNYELLAILYYNYALLDESSIGKTMMYQALEIWEDLYRRFPNNESYAKWVNTVLSSLY